MDEIVTSPAPQNDAGSSLFAEFQEFRRSRDVLGVKLSAVPEGLRPLIREYREALTRQLGDPENQSWDSLGPNERHNALLAVRHMCGKQDAITKPKGNCPRCGGHGHIAAFSHIKGGVCLKCNGTGNV